MPLEGTLNDTDMVLIKLMPDGPVQGAPVWSVASGNGTLLSDPTHQAWDQTLPEGHQMFLVSQTLPSGEPGPVDTVYEVMADVDLGTAVEALVDQIIMHVVNKASSLGLTASMPMPKP